MVKRYGIPLSTEVISSELLMVDTDDEWMIIPQEQIHLFPHEALVDIEPLIELEQPELTDLFTDYGFISIGNRVYLFEDIVTPFSIISGEPTEVAMMLLQLEEYMVAQEKKEKETIYFIGKHYSDLLTKIASTYDITIRIFDLDK